MSKKSRSRWGHVENTTESKFRHNSNYLSNCTIDNVDDLVLTEKPYTYESDYYIMSCLADLPRPKYRKD